MCIVTFIGVSKETKLVGVAVSTTINLSDLNSFGEEILI
jgi:hypothetical protein